MFVAVSPEANAAVPVEELTMLDNEFASHARLSALD
jgi:hypothetical protein